MRPAAAPGGPGTHDEDIDRGRHAADGNLPTRRRPIDRFDVGGPGGPESPAAFLGKQEWYEHRCLREADPRPGHARRAHAEHTLKREGKLILDESDSFGVEMALQLVDKAGGGEVTLVSIAPNDEVSGLRTALAMGAAKAVLVSDPSSPAPTR